MLLLLSGSVYYCSSQMVTKVEEFKASKPFLSVTNRDFSIFLWQNPQYMRINQKTKTGYLPAFQYLSGVTVEPELADRFVQVPDDVLFFYHAWKRLIGEVYFSRSIPQKEFLKFLNEDPQWQPRYWKEAPDEYKELLELIRGGNDYDNLNLLSDQEMPKEVRQAFQGWKNYTLEGTAINNVDPSYSELNFFLTLYPEYSRHNWQNYLSDTVPNYLKSTGKKGAEKLPKDEMAPFFKTAIYNFLQSSAP